MRPRYDGSTTCKRGQTEGEYNGRPLLNCRLYNIEIDIGEKEGRSDYCLLPFYIRPAFKISNDQRLYI